MLSKLQTQPFQYIICNLKKLVSQKQVQKEQDQIKRTLKTLTQILNLNEFLTILLDYHWFNKLTTMMQSLLQLTQYERKTNKNIQNYENLSTSPLKTYDQNRQHLINRCKKQQLTPSTKKSKVILNPNINLLIEDLIESLQKFDQIKPKTKRIKLLIQELYEEFNNNQNQQQQQQRDSNKQSDIESIWRQLSFIDFQNLTIKQQTYFNINKVSYLKQLFQQIQTIYKFMQVIRSTTHQIFNLIQYKSIDQIQNRSRDLSLIDTLTKKSHNLSQQRSLLTQMLKDSSQRSNLQINENQYSSQIILKHKTKQYSQKDDLAFLDQHYRISTKSVQPNRKSQKWIKSQMSCALDQLNKSNNFTIKKKQIKIKKSQMGCSQCEIF